MLEAQLRLKLDMFFKLTALPLSTAWSVPSSVDTGLANYSSIKTDKRQEILAIKTYSCKLYKQIQL